METVTHSDFSVKCPECSSDAIHVLTQKNNFQGENQEEDGDQRRETAFSSNHNTTSRTYCCNICSHKWVETVPHPR